MDIVWEPKSFIVFQKQKKKMTIEKEKKNKGEVIEMTQRFPKKKYKAK